MLGRSIGTIFLILFLAVTGLLAVSNFQIEQSRFVLGGLALLAAIFLAWGK